MSTSGGNGETVAPPIIVSTSSVSESAEESLDSVSGISSDSVNTASGEGESESSLDSRSRDDDPLTQVELPRSLSVTIEAVPTIPLVSLLTDEEGREGDSKLDLLHAKGSAEDDGGNVFFQEQELEYSEYEGEEDDTLSSEAIVDDIELILMPEELQELGDLSPKLVRVTELTAQRDVYLRDENDGAAFPGQSDFQKFDSHDLSEAFGEKALMTFSSEDDVGIQSPRLSTTMHEAGSKISSGVQTDITALEVENVFYSSSYEFRRKASVPSVPRLSVPAKKLNWKSELTLLPSKTKIGRGGFSSYAGTDERDQYAPRVAKFTSQDTLSCSSQFLKPSTLYRTRNLSRNLNQCASSESTLVLPEMPSDYGLYRGGRISTSSSAANFKGDDYQSQSYHMSSSHRSGYGGGGGTRGRLLSASSSFAKTIRSSLPDLSVLAQSSHDNNSSRHSHKKLSHRVSSGSRLQKKLSSSDDETSSLIDESERCLRSSIDLLLSEDYSRSLSQFPYRSTGHGLAGGSSSTSYYSSRRSYSQPVLTDVGYGPDPRDPNMGSPFLPNKLSDMRCSKWAKVILPNGHVAVVSVKETDEFHDTLTVHTDTGCIVQIPFRKVVFAWKLKRLL